MGCFAWRVRDEWGVSKFELSEMMAFIFICINIDDGRANDG